MVRRSSHEHPQATQNAADQTKRQEASITGKEVFFIAAKHLPYFPSIPLDLQESDEQEAGSDTHAQKAKKKFSRLANRVHKKVGRPKKNVVMGSNQPYILTLLIKKGS